MAVLDFGLWCHELVPSQQSLCFLGCFLWCRLRHRQSTSSHHHRTVHNPKLSNPLSVITLKNHGCFQSLGRRTLWESVPDELYSSLKGIIVQRGIKERLSLIHLKWFIWELNKISLGKFPAQSKFSTNVGPLTFSQSFGVLSKRRQGCVMFNVVI